MEYYAPKARAEVEAVEAVVWELVKHRFSDSTVKWANINEHPHTGKFGCILPEGWRGLLYIPAVDIQTHEQMKAAGWFPTSDTLTEEI